MVGQERIHSYTGLGIRRGIWQQWRRVKKAVALRRRRAKVFLISMADPVRRQAMQGLREYLKSALADDPDMWRWLRRWIRVVVDDLWRDVETEVDVAVEDVRKGIETKGRCFQDMQSLAMIGTTPSRCSWRGLRAFVLYHFLPFDKSIFGCIKDPVFCILFLLSLVPDVRVCLYLAILILFAVPGPLDEYQLVQYIMAFKGTQFLCSGVALALSGGIQYYLCVEDDEHHSCATRGPGSSVDPRWDMLDILGSCALTWAGFWLLPYSERSAGLRRPDKDADEVALGHSDAGGSLFGWTWKDGRGGRLTRLLRYDQLCALLALLVVAGLAIKHCYQEAERCHKGTLWDIVHRWQFQALLFWARVFYSLMALPFLLLNIPILLSIFTHTVPTGFNRNGAAVAWIMSPMPDDEGEDDDEEQGGSEMSSPWMTPRLDAMTLVATALASPSNSRMTVALGPYP